MSDDRFSLPSRNRGRQPRSRGAGRAQPGMASGPHRPFVQDDASQFSGNMQLQPQGVFVPYARGGGMPDNQEPFWRQQFLPPSPPPPPQMIPVGEFSPRPPRSNRPQATPQPPQPHTNVQVQQPQQQNQQYVPPRAYQSKPQCPPGPEPPVQAPRFAIGSLTAPPRRGDPRAPGYSKIVQPIQNQNAGTNRGYGALIVNKPEANAIPPMGIDIGMIEICTFFPSWLLIPDVSMRAIRNGWARKDLAKAQLHAMGLLNKANLKTVEERIQKQISEGGRLYCNMSADERWDTEKRVEEWGSETDLTGHLWQLRSEYAQQGTSDWGHVQLTTAANDVVNWPTQQDSLLLTRCIRFAVANPHLRLDTSHYHLIIQSQGWLYPNPPPLDDDHDRQAVNRLRQNVNDPQS